MKIKEKELKKIQEQQTKLNELVHNIGLLESQKHGLLHEIAGVNKDIDRLINEDITPEHDNEYLRKTRARARSRGKSYRQRPEVKAREAKRRRDKRRSDPAFRLRNNVSALVYEALVVKQGKTKGGSTFAQLEYTPAQLKEHLESQFDADMSWDNYGTYWQLDHVIPQAALIYDSLTHPNFKKCWSLDNLRPLERKENQRKGSFHAGKRYYYSD